MKRSYFWTIGQHIEFRQYILHAAMHKIFVLNAARSNDHSEIYVVLGFDGPPCIISTHLG